MKRKRYMDDQRQTGFAGRTFCAMGEGRGYTIVSKQHIKGRMKLTTRTGRRCFPLLLAGLLTAGLCTAGAQQVGDVHPTTVSTDPGRKLPSATRSSSSSTSNVMLERMLLLLQPSTDQQKS